MGWFGSSPDLVTIANLQHPGPSSVWLVPDHVKSIQLGRKRVPVYLMLLRRCAVHVHGVCIHLSSVCFHASKHFSVITRTVTLVSVHKDISTELVFQTFLEQDRTTAGRACACCFDFFLLDCCFAFVCQRCSRIKPL